MLVKVLVTLSAGADLLQVKVQVPGLASSLYEHVHLAFVRKDLKKTLQVISHSDI